MSLKATLTTDVPTEVLQTAVRAASKRALDESAALGLTITVYENGQLLRITPDGQREVVEDPYRDLLTTPQ